ncbi:MAG: hypothetical protein CMM94_03360 [Rickettsiales bacterium]|nr:hypothetical protein [Rickettsiales bacterium]
MSYFTFLRTFITVYRSGSYNKASRQLNLTQPAISKQISSLEQQMGKQLFRRNGNGKGLEPTRIADELANSLAHHIDSIEVIFNQSRATSEDVEGTVHIGGPKEFNNAKMIPAFASLAEHNIKTVLQVSSPNKVHELIQEDILDLAITERFVENSSIGYRKIYQCELVLLAAPEWKEKLEGKPITPQLLSEVPMLVYEEKFNYIHKYYAEVFKQDQIDRPVISVEDLSIIQNLLCQGVGYSVLPKCMVEENLNQGQLHILLSPANPPISTVYLLWNKNSMRKKRNVLTRDAILEEAEKW